MAGQYLSLVHVLQAEVDKAVVSALAYTTYNDFQLHNPAQISADRVTVILRTLRRKPTIIVRISFQKGNLGIFTAVLQDVWAHVQAAYPNWRPLNAGKPIWCDSTDGHLRLGFSLSPKRSALSSWAVEG